MRKLLYPVIFVTIVVLVGVYVTGVREVEAAKVTVEITRDSPFNVLNESERDGLIGSISLDKVYMKKLASPGGNEMFMPGISVGVFRDGLMVSEWVSAPVHDKGMYELTLGLNKALEKGDTLRIAVYVNDDKGNAIIGKRKDVVWG